MMRSLLIALTTLACSHEDAPCKAAACTSGFDVIVSPDPSSPAFTPGDYSIELVIDGTPRTVHCKLGGASTCDAKEVVPATSAAGVFQLAIRLPVVGSVSIKIRSGCTVGEQTFTPQYETIDPGCGGKCTQASAAMVLGGSMSPTCVDGIVDAATDAMDAAADTADALTEAATDTLDN